MLCYQVLAIVAACELGSGLPVFPGSHSDSVGLKEAELGDSHWTVRWFHNKDNSDQVNQALGDRARCVVGGRKTVAKPLVCTLGERLLGTSGPCTSVYRLAVGTTSGPESCFTSGCHSQAPASSSQS